MTLKDVLEITTSYVTIYVTHFITNDKIARFTFDRDFVETSFEKILEGWGCCEVESIKSESADSIRIDIIDRR